MEEEEEDASKPKVKTQKKSGKEISKTRKSKLDKKNMFTTLEMVKQKAQVR